MAVKNKSAQKDKRIFHIDLLRALTIIIIIWVFHISNYSSVDYISNEFDFILYISLGIIIYISGYFLSKHNPNLDTKEKVMTFARKRLLRIYPLYLIALLLFILTYDMDTFEILSHVFLVNTIIGNSVETLWFVSMICLFYFLFPLIVYYSSIKKVILRSLIIFFLFNLLILFSFGNMTDHFIKINYRLIIFWPTFIFGVIIGTSERFSKMIERSNVILIGLLLSIIIIPIVTFDIIQIFSNNKWLNFGIDTYLWMSFTFFIIPCILFISRLISKYVKNRFIIHMSYISFSLYLFHRIIFVSLLRVYEPESNPMKILYLYLVGTPLIIVFSYILQRFYNKCIYRQLFAITS